MISVQTRASRQEAEIKGIPIGKEEVKTLHLILCISFAGFWVERTPVHEAAQRGESLQLQRLIESGACVNQVTVDSITPLHAASLQGQARCVQLLLAAGAQVSGPLRQTPCLAVAAQRNGGD